MTIRTKLNDLLGIEHPVLLAPMAGVSGGALAAAVTQAGGLGQIGGGYGDADWLSREFAAAGNARLGVGFITWKLAQQPHLLDMVLERQPVAVFLSFGDAGSFAEPIRQSGSKLIMQVQTLDQARAAIDAGADAIVAQGTEAGGHGGSRATLPLVPAVVDIAGELPVIAAGGIADGRGMAAALMLGAAGVLCGTAFFASDEALSPEGAKTVATAASGDHTLRSSVFDVARGLDWPGAWNLRTLRNHFSDRWAGEVESLKADAAVQRDIYASAAAKGDFDTAAVIVGEGVDLVMRREPAADILTRMVAEAEALLKAAPGYIAARQ